MTNEKTIQLGNQTGKPAETVGEMHKRRETMADGRRYILYYTFGENAQSSDIKPSERAVTEEQKV